VLADWWFSLALSKDLYQLMPGKKAYRRYSWLTEKVLASSERQPLKGLSDTLAAIVSGLGRAWSDGSGIKNFLD
jgi:hypothetical protein